MLAYSSRLVTIKAIIAGMTNYAMCALKVHMTCLDHVEKSSRVFLWHGKEINKCGKCLVKWEKVCLPKNAGGLGVLNLREQNKALMIKNLFKYYNKANIPWVDLIWQAYYQNGNFLIQIIAKDPSGGEIVLTITTNLKRSSNANLLLAQQSSVGMISGATMKS
jgi:hypothetical protein